MAIDAKGGHHTTTSNDKADEQHDMIVTAQPSTCNNKILHEGHLTSSLYGN